MKSRPERRNRQELRRKIMQPNSLMPGNKRELLIISLLRVQSKERQRESLTVSLPREHLSRGLRKGQPTIRDL